MFGGINGIGKFLGLLVDFVRKIAVRRRKRKAQRRYDRIESDPVAEFQRRYGGLQYPSDEQKAKDASKTKVGERERER